MSSQHSVEFDVAVDNLQSFGASLKVLISTLLSENDLHVHSVDFRVKGRESANRKLSRGVDKYSGFEDLKDLLGVRVITYFADEVDKVANILSPQFDVDPDHSVDKRSLMEPDRFGYMSLHYVAKLNSSRSELAEYKRFAAQFFELQIRSILQHAWAEIEHDLGYKADGGLPREFRRRFSRLAGLLELADDEFFRLRDDLQRHEIEVTNELATSPENLELDQTTITALLRSPDFESADGEICKILDRPIAPTFEPRYISTRAAELTALDISNIDSLTRLFEVRRTHLIRFAQIWVDRKLVPSTIGRIPHGISLLFLGYTLVPGSSENQRQNWLGADRFREGVLPQINSVWREVVKEIGEPAATP